MGFQNSGLHSNVFLFFQHELCRQCTLLQPTCRLLHLSLPLLLPKVPRPSCKSNAAMLAAPLPADPI